MPQIQVIGREAVEDQNNQANQAIERARMAQEAGQKAIYFKQMADQLKLEAKNTENDVEKIKTQRLGDRMNYMAAVMKLAMDNPNDPQGVIMTAMKLGGPDLMKDMTDPQVQELIKRVTPSAEAQQRQAQANALNTWVGGYGGGGGEEDTAGLGGGADVANAPVTGGDMGNTSRVGALGGGYRRGPVLTGGNILGLQFEDYDAQARGAADKAGLVKEAENKEDMRKSAMAGLALIDELEQGWNAAFKNAPETGSKFITGASDVALGSWGRQNSDIRAYLTTRAAALTNIARALGERGVITNQDVARVEMGTAGAFDNKETARKQFAAIRRIMTRGIVMYNKYGKYWWSKVASDYGDAATGTESIAAPVADLTGNSNDPAGIF